MNTKQKLTIGIAAIFMVTLTIVGVTYAYFVTRVTGDENTPVNVSTATLGDVVYVPGNDGLNNSDVITLTDVLPGQGTVYKKFAVQNQNTDTTALASYFEIITTNAVTADKGEFIHTANGKNEGDVLTTCYAYNPAAGLDALVTEPKMSTEADAPELCFADEGIYNNIKITLWQVDESAYNAGITSDPTGNAINTVNQLTYNDTDVISGRLSVASNTTQYYVLKVEYLNVNYNQNAENLAGLDVLVSIQAA